MFFYPAEAFFVKTGQFALRTRFIRLCRQTQIHKGFGLVFG